MLDQTFSIQNFERIYNIEMRKGNINKDDMPEKYCKLLNRIKETKKRINELKKIGKVNITEEETEELRRLNIELEKQKEKKKEELLLYISELSEKVSSHNFRFSISKFLIDKKEIFEIDKKDFASFYAMKQLQYNIRKTFKVKQANRHAILSNIKVLLNSKVPVYVIRTDISSFYESIKQDQLLEMIDNNTLLSYKSKSFIRAIINLYENLKDKAKVLPNVGIPRGVGISAYLSELYMRDIDLSIRNLAEVIFYARYVDDIFIILSFLPARKDIESYYDDIEKFFSKKGLFLKHPNDGTSKCFLLDFTKENVKKIEMDYLGYKLCMERTNYMLKTEYALSNHKIKNICNKIDNAFRHFKWQSASNIKKARRDLIASINYISGNTRLYKSKSGVKIGLFYNNDLLDDKDGLDALTSYLRKKRILFHKNLFGKKSDKLKFSKALRKRIQKINFKDRWEERKMYKFSMERLKEFNRWL